MQLNDKIIIHNYTNLPDFEVIDYIGRVIGNGKISKTKQGKQYCFVTTFKDGYTVSSGRRNNTYTFMIEKRQV